MRPVKLSDFTAEELQAELEKRKIVVPDPVATPDFSKLVACVVDHVKDCSDANNIDDGDSHQFVFEAAMEAVYGPDCWIWFNALPGNA